MLRSHECGGALITGNIELEAGWPIIWISTPSRRLDLMGDMVYIPTLVLES